MRPDIGGEALGGFIQCWGGRVGGGGNQCTQFQITINHPAMSTIKKLLLELRHPENVSFSKHGTKAERRRIQAGPAEVGRGLL